MGGPWGLTEGAWRGMTTSGKPLRGYRGSRCGLQGKTRSCPGGVSIHGLHAVSPISLCLCSADFHPPSEMHLTPVKP